VVISRHGLAAPWTGVRVRREEDLDVDAVICDTGYRPDHSWIERPMLDARERTYPLAAIAVAEERREPSPAQQFDRLRGAPELEAEREGLAPYLAAEPGKTLVLVAEMDLGGPEVEQGAVCACPMHSVIIASGGQVPEVRDACTCA
jgi:hypothetical protein